MLGETEKSSDMCRTASLSEMGHEQTAATSSTVTDQRRKTSLSISRRSWSRYRQIAVCCRSEMTSASGGRNRVAHHCKVDWCLLVKTLENQQTHLVLQALLNGQPVQSISDVAVGISRQRNSGYKPSRINIMAQGLSTPNPSLSPTHLSIRSATTTHTIRLAWWCRATLH